MLGRWAESPLVLGENNPGKVSEIPALLRKYKGKENKLWRKLNKKYERKDED